MRFSVEKGGLSLRGPVFGGLCKHPLTPLPCSNAALCLSMSAETRGFSLCPLSTASLGHPVDVSAVMQRDRLCAITPFSHITISWYVVTDLHTHKSPRPEGHACWVMPG